MAKAKTNNSTKANKAAKRVRKPRRIMPEKPDYVPDGPTEFDVVSGRGGGSNHHAGNKRYWEKILPARDIYKNLEKADDDEKTAIAESIMHFIDNSYGRFLQKEAKTGRWFILPPKIVIDKIKQALRDEYVPLFARDRYPYTPKSKSKKGGDKSGRSASPKPEPTPKPVQNEPEIPENLQLPQELENILRMPSSDHSFGVKAQPSFFTGSTDFATEFFKSYKSPSTADPFQKASSQPSMSGNPFLSTDLNDFLKSHVSTNEMHGDLLKGDLLKSSNFLKSMESLKLFNSLDFAKTSLDQSFGSVFPKSSLISSRDDLKMEMSRLPDIRSLDILQSMSMDNASSNNPFINPCALNKTLTSWNEAFDKEFTAV